MSGLTISERARVAGLVASTVRRRAVARLLASPLLRWRYGAPHAEALTMVPQELRAIDASFAAEVKHGQFGLADALAVDVRGSPFDVHPPSADWARVLHGFGWLRHFSAGDDPETTSKARALVDEWIGYGQGRHDEAWEPAVIGRRIQSWLANAGLLLENVEQRAFDRVATSLVAQLARLSAVWASGPDGDPRLQALIGLVYGDICIAGHEAHLAVAERSLGAELDRQILRDGGHVSRDPGVLIELLLDLLPLRQCYIRRQRKLPPPIDAAIERMLPMLRYMRLGDGSLARFNGVGVPPVAELATVLAYDQRGGTPLETAPASGYARLAQGGLVLIADVAGAPRIDLSARAHAGCLSFELSAGACAVFVNGGAPRAADAAQVTAARATASHTTLSLGDRSSARLLRHARLQRIAGGPGLQGPSRVTSRVERSDGGVTLEASHDGYVRPFGLFYKRRVTVAADGARVEGVDELGGGQRSLRLARDIPFAVHFHLDPRVGSEVLPGGGIELSLRDGSRWLFTATGAELSLEPSIHYADPAGIVRSRQIVLRGACWGETKVEWRLVRDRA